jgi:glutaredoxin 3
MVKVYTMSSCPYCEAAKRLLTQRGIEFQEIKVPLDDDAQWEQLYQLSGMRTMPQIFAGDRLIGGYRELTLEDKKDTLASLK